MRRNPNLTHWTARRKRDRALRYATVLVWTTLAAILLGHAAATAAPVHDPVDLCADPYQPKPGDPCDDGGEAAWTAAKTSQPGPAYPPGPCDGAAYPPPADCLNVTPLPTPTPDGNLPRTGPSSDPTWLLAFSITGIVAGLAAVVIERRKDDE